MRGRKPSLRPFPAPITDPSGAVVPGVSVTIASQGTGLKRSALTDSSGEYRFAGLPTGNYSLRIEKTGFQSQTREGVQLTSAVEVRVNLQLAVGDIAQQTTVSANAAGIDSESWRKQDSDRRFAKESSSIRLSK